MLLRLEAETERGFMVDGTREVIRRKYDKLAPRREKVGEGKRERERIVDQIVSLLEASLGGVCLSQDLS
jgi:hypothetical protein